MVADSPWIARRRDDGAYVCQAVSGGVSDSVREAVLRNAHRDDHPSFASTQDTGRHCGKVRTQTYTLWCVHRRRRNAYRMGTALFDVDGERH